MQMAVNVCSKRANIILAWQGRPWYSTGKPPWCCLAKRGSVWPLSPGRSSTSGRAPSGLERKSRSGIRHAIVADVCFTWNILWFSLGFSIMRSFWVGRQVKCIRKCNSKVKGAFKSAFFAFFQRMSTQQSHLDERQRNEATFAESERSWLALLRLQGKLFVV